MKKIILILCSVFVTITSFAQPIIATFSPTSDTIGSIVTIIGTGFDSNASQNIVFFGATKALVTTANSTSLTVIVPQGATYEYLSVTNLSNNLTAYSTQPFVVTLDGAILFAPRIDSIVGTRPYSVSIGDLDGDGKSDIIVANSGDSTISVFRNTSTLGIVSFEAKVDFVAGLFPNFVSVGDLDGDGKLDLAVTSNQISKISLFLNTSSLGTISFGPKITYSVFGYPTTINIGDIDGDGKLDLVVLNDNKLSIFPNTSTLGNLNFAANIDFATGNYPSAVAIGDIDGDTKPDISVTLGATTLSIFRNTSTLGAINFAPNVDFTTSFRPQSISIGDIDGDGKPDLVAAGQVVSVHRNISSLGTINFDTKIDFGTYASSSLASIGDIDGDGKLDVATVAYNYGTAGNYSIKLAVFQNISTAGIINFEPKANFAVGSFPHSVKIGDIDGDNKPDLVTANYGSNSISVLLQVAYPPSSGAPPVISSFFPKKDSIGSTVTITGTGFNSIANQNIVFFGATKAVVTAASPTSLTVLVPIGATYDFIAATNLSTNLTSYSTQPFIVTLAGNIFFAPRIDSLIGFRPLSVDLEDLDGDGNSDIIVTGTDSTIAIFRNISTIGNLNFEPKIIIKTNFYNRDLSIGDIDGDGKLDLVILSDQDDNISIFHNSSILGAISFGAKVDLIAEYTYNISIVDVDGDGKLDIVSAGIFEISVFKNVSTPNSINFAPKISFTSTVSYDLIDATDLDGDGKVDLVVRNGYTKISIFRNTSAIDSINFAPEIVLTSFTNLTSVKLVDIDGDEKIDILVTDNAFTYPIFILRNTSTLGNISFAPKINFTTVASTYPAIFGDIDGDGKVDMLVTSLNSTSIFPNLSTPGTIAFAPISSLIAGSASIGSSIGDLDGDGKPDVVIINQTSQTVSVFRQETPIKITDFTPKSGAIGSSVTITGTGFNSAANQNIVFFGATKAVVTAASSTNLTVTVPLGATYQDISVLNLQNNLTAYSNKPFVVTFWGDIFFAPKHDIATGTTPKTVCIKDIDGDGKPDLAFANYNNNSFTIYRNTSTAGNISFAVRKDITTLSKPSSINVEDINGDGKPDLILTMPNNPLAEIYVYLNNSSPGTINFPNPLYISIIQTTNSVTTKDIDGDGKVDLIIKELGEDGQVVLNTSPIGSLSFRTATTFTDYFMGYSDLNGDSKPDFVSNNMALVSYSNNSTFGNLNFSNQSKTRSLPKNSASFGDFDNDGKMDMAVNDYTNKVLVLRNNVSLGVIDFDPEIDFSTGTQPAHVSVGDIDGDNKVDLVVANYGSNSVSVFRNTSTPNNISFVSKIDFPTGTNPNNLNIGDIDGDGKPDLVVINSTNNSISILRQIAAPPPMVTSFSPQGGCANTDQVVIVGTNFTNATAVKFGGTDALSFIINTESRITAIVGSGTTGKVSVTTKNGTGTSLGTFAVRPLPDVSTTFNGSVITANQTNASYQWINCVLNYSIPGATSRTFNTTNNGNYSVIVTKDGCSDTSICLNSVAIEEIPNNNAFYIYPNPFSTETTIYLDNLYDDATFVVYNSFGQQVKQIGNVRNQEVTFNREDLVNGIYFIHLIQGKKIIAIKKLVVSD